MNFEKSELKRLLQEELKKHVPPLKINKDNEATFELCGTKKRMQGKQMVDGFYFGSIVEKPKDIRLYFFPIYTHVNEFSLSGGLKKYLKGKSCFHLKNISEDTFEEIKQMIKKGVEVYTKEDLI